jgi:hypothetical protein
MINHISLKYTTYGIITGLTFTLAIYLLYSLIIKNKLVNKTYASVLSVFLILPLIGLVLIYVIKKTTIEYKFQNEYYFGLVVSILLSEIFLLIPIIKKYEIMKNNKTVEIEGNKYKITIKGFKFYADQKEVIKIKGRWSFANKQNRPSNEQ